MVTQIRFRQKVLGQTHEDHTVFHVTKDREYLTIQQLTENLCKLLVPPPKGDPLPSTHMSQEVLLHHPESSVAGELSISSSMRTIQLLGGKAQF